MAADGDMNATPLGSLPPPAAGMLPPPLTTAERSQALQVPSYQDLVGDATQAPQAPPAPQPAPMQPAPMQVAPMQPAPMQVAPMQVAPMQPAPMQPAYQPSVQGFYDGSAPPGPPPPPPERPGRGAVAAFLVRHRAPIAVFLIVLCLLAFALPRLHRVHRFLTPEGRLNLLGKAAAAGIASGTYALAMAVSPA